MARKPATKIGWLKLDSPSGFAAATVAGRLYTYDHRAATVDYPARIFRDRESAARYAREIARRLKKTYIGELTP